MSDDIELNVKTLEPEEKETEEFSEEEYNCGRVPMRKPATLVQYWVNTGNTPYKVFLNREELSESGSSLSEEEITSPSYSLLSNKANESSKHKQDSDTSFSSVDTAAYILSNANVTKKADTIAIIEGAKSNVIKSSEDDCVKDVGTVYNDRTTCIETVATDHLLHNENSNNISHNDISQAISMGNEIPDTNNQLVTSTVISANTAQFDVSSNNSCCDTINKPDVLNASPKNVDLHNIDHIVNIFQQFNETSKRLSTDDKSNDLSKNKALKEHRFNEKQQVPVSADTANTVRKNASLTPFHRKKLYTGRNSPVDVILTERNSSDVDKPKSPDTRLSLHPALDPDNSIGSKSLIHKDKNKHNLVSKKTLGSKKVQAKKGQKHSSVSNKNIGDKAVVTNNNTIDNNNTLDSFVDSSVQNLSSSPNEVDKSNSDNLIRDCDNINIMKNATQKYPVILLEEIQGIPFKEKKSKSVTNEDITQGNSTDNDSVPLRHLHDTYQIESVESADSDQSTIFICECNNITLQDSSSVSSSFNLRLSTGDNGSTMNAEKEDDKLTNLENIKLNKKVLVILERLPQSVIERYTKTTHALNMKGDLPISSKKLPNKSKIYSSNSYGTNIKNDVKLREVKVILERLSADMYPKKSNNATSINFPTVKNKIAQDTSINNNKRKFKNTIKSPNGENKKAARTIRKINNNYSLRIHTRSKIGDSEMNNTSDDVAQHDNQISNRTGSNFASRYRNHDSQNKRRKCSVLDFTSSDENDFVRLIQPSEKKLKTLTNKTSKTHIAGKDLYDEATLVSTNKNKYDSNENISTTIYSSKQNNLRKIDGSIREKNRRDEAEVKFSDTTSTDSFLIYKHKKFSLFTRRSDQCDKTMKNINGRRKRYLFSNTENISNNSERYLNKATMENRISRRNDTYITLFQTKTFNIESSDSDESNYDNTSIRKSLRTASTNDRVQFNGHANKDKLCNDSHAKTHANKQLHSLNSFTKRYNAANKMHNAKKRSRSVIGTTETDERFDKEFRESNNNINSCTGITTKTMPYLPVANNTRSTLMQKDNAILNASLRNNSPNKLLRNRQIPEKLSLKNPQANQQRDVKSEVNKSLIFQTKSYYDSDSSEC